MRYTPNLQPVHHWDAQGLSFAYLVSLACSKTYECTMMSGVSKKCVQKSHNTWQKPALLMLWLLQQVRVVSKEVQNSLIMWQATTNMVAVCVLRFMAFDITHWKLSLTPRKKGNKVSMLTLNSLNFNCLFILHMPLCLEDSIWLPRWWGNWKQTQHICAIHLLRNRCHHHHYPSRLLAYRAATTLKLISLLLFP